MINRLKYFNANIQFDLLSLWHEIINIINYLIQKSYEE